MDKGLPSVLLNYWNLVILHLNFFLTSQRHPEVNMGCLSVLPGRRHRRGDGELLRVLQQDLPRSHHHCCVSGDTWLCCNQQVYATLCHLPAEAGHSAVMSIGGWG